MAGNSFRANPRLTCGGVVGMRSIAEQAHALVNDPAGRHGMLTGRACVDDGHARRVGPRIRKIYQQTTASGQQATGAAEASEFGGRR
ncbi:hypothetical protein GCM10010269_82970 [Streptomyces humidus]|uniref:Uncharacterized protein n=1 Tax=Streptomyces humidus TaxID=52259 RepID=A0A918LDD4_9ACTN|nr:hypothetical protein [Streptomyces humidus]GGS32025.1 hypothetical protein GCM10010269_82970 [Streptomyces humidus]